MRRLVVALLSALVLAPLPLRAQSVTLDICDTGTVDIDVFVSRAGSVSASHIRPSTCAAVAKSAGGMEASFVGIAFADSRGQWGAARRFDRVPSLGVRELPLATRLGMSASGVPIPRSPDILTTANSTASVRHGNATVTLPLSLLFQPPGPECRRVGTGNTTTTRTGRTETTIIETTTTCEDVVYTLTVEPFVDSREASLGRLDTGGFFSDGPLNTTIVHENAHMDWAEAAAERKLREAPQSITWNDLLPAFRRALSGERLQSGARLTVPDYITVRGTVSAVELRQHPIDAATNLTVAEINFRESPPAAGGRYPEFNVCTDRLDVLQELFGADYRTSLIGKTIEVQGKPEGLCWGQVGEIQIFLARQLRPVPSAQFAAGTRVWLPPPPYVAPAAPPSTQAQNDAAVMAFAKVVAEDRQRGESSRLRRVCSEQMDSALASNPADRERIINERIACLRRADGELQKFGERVQSCAIQAMKGEVQRAGRDPDGFYRDVDACMDTPPATSKQPATTGLGR